MMNRQQQNNQLFNVTFEENQFDNELQQSPPAKDSYLHDNSGNNGLGKSMNTTAASVVQGSSSAATANATRGFQNDLAKAYMQLNFEKQNQQ